MYTICTEVTTTKSKSQIINERARSRRPNRPCVINNQNALKIGKVLFNYS